METAIYESECVVARTCTEQIIDLRLTLRYLGVPIRDKCYILGDNKPVVNRASQPQAKMHKRHIFFSFHPVHEALAAGIMAFCHIPGSDNPANILTKL